MVDETVRELVCTDHVDRNHRCETVERGDHRHVPGHDQGSLFGVHAAADDGRRGKQGEGENNGDHHVPTRHAKPPVRDDGYQTLDLWKIAEGILGLHFCTTARTP